MMAKGEAMIVDPNDPNNIDALFASSDEESDDSD